MKSIPALVAELADSPRPVLCLDTCVLLDIVRACNRGDGNLIEVSRRLSDIVITAPNALQIVVTSLVMREWRQNREQVLKEAADWLEDTDKRILGIHRAWEKLGRPLQTLRPTYNQPDLVEGLKRLAESLLRSSVALREDSACVARALQRVKRKTRPSHNRQIKDSINFETYLEFSRSLKAEAFSPPVLFVNTNSSDFWEDKGKLQPHAELIDDLTAADLCFFGKLPPALGHLGLLGPVASDPSITGGL